MFPSEERERERERKTRQEAIMQPVQRRGKRYFGQRGRDSFPFEVEVEHGERESVCDGSGPHRDEAGMQLNVQESSRLSGEGRREKGTQTE